MLNWDDYNVAEGEAPTAAPQQQAPVQPEVVNKALETLNEQSAESTAATDQVKAAADAIANLDATPGLGSLFTEFIFNVLSALNANP